MSSRVVEYGKEPSEAWEDLLAASKAIGRIEESRENARYLIVKARYGLNPVRLRVSIRSGNDRATSILDIEGRGQDVWGVASRKIIDRLIGTMSDL